MKIAICIKWVPALARMKFDPETRRIVREGVPHEINNYDTLALQWAVQLRQDHDVDISVFTMGPPQAAQGLVQCIARGADHVYHILGREFAGADTLATSQALALALRREPFDLVLFGLHSLDAETGQVGPEVAELMDLPQVTGVSKLDISDDATKVIAQRELEEGSEVVECRMPCLVSVTDGVAPEVAAGRDAMMAAREREAEIVEISPQELSDDMSIFGQQGSPTWVSEIRIVETTREQQVLEEMEPQEAARRIVAYIKEKGLLKPEARVVRRVEGKPAPSTVRPVDGPGVWVLAETGPKGVRPVVRELLGEAQSVADQMHGHVAAVLMGGPEIASYAEELGHAGADVVYLAADQALANYTTEAHASTLGAAIEAHSPYAVLLSSSTNGRDLAARVAGRLKLGLTGDCIGLEVDGEGQLVQLKPAFGGNIVAPIFSKTKPYMTTIRAGILDQVEPDTSRQAEVRTLAVVAPDNPAVQVLESHRYEVTPDALLNAWAVVSVGMGMGGKEQIPALDPLVELLDAKVGCTRDVVEAGWLPKRQQVGISGTSVAPALYITVGVRGDFNHTVGIQRAGTVVAINNNRRAPIFRNADIGVVADWESMVPALTAELEKELG